MMLTLPCLSPGKELPGETAGAEGTVIYEQVAQLEIRLEGDAEQLAHDLPKEQRSEKILYFTKEAALYKNWQAADEAEPDLEEGGMVIRMQEPDNQTFFDLKNRKVIRQQEFMTRLFLIESDMESGNWKLTGGQRRILEYDCSEAETKKDGKIIRAWFTPGIPVSAGPGSFSNLPGLILALDVDGGKTVIEAKSVELGPVDSDIIRKPRKGKKVTGEEYQAIVEEKLKEMGVEGGGSPGTGHATIVVKVHQ